jgi:predicted metal-dependent phosphoesterase TrpH
MTAAVTRDIAPAMTIDLHTHSDFSDGTDSPARLMAAAQQAGLTTVAITDHDTTAGWKVAERDRPDHLTLVRGAEWSTHLVAGGDRVSVHLLAYLFDPADRALAAELDRLRADRAERGMAIVDRLVADGIPITREQVRDIAGNAAIGRPHIGRALVTTGLVASVTEAFATYLSWRGPYFVRKEDTDLHAAIGLVRGAGGVPVIAHPRSRGAARMLDEAVLAELRDDGLAGIEVDHPDHTPTARAELRAIANRLGLIGTGSSDYHGANKALRIGQDRSSEAALAAIVAASSGATPLLGPGA